MEKVASTYLKELNIPASKNYFEKLVTSHPDYPSILSVSDTFERLGIRHNVARIKKDDLSRVPFPYLLHLDRGSGKFLLIRDQNDVEINEEKLEAWDGVVMLAEPTRTINDAVNDQYLSEERFNKISTILFASSAALLLILFVLRRFSEGENILWAALLLLATAIGGVVLGYLLIAKDLGIQYKAVDSFCNAGKNTNCDRLLKSQNATIFGPFKLSDAVLSYFTFQLIVLGFFVPVMEEASEFLWILSTGSILAIPVVVYSVYLQGAVLKSWCRLCLLVDAVLLIQAALFGWMYMANIIVWSDADVWATGLSTLLLLATASLIFLLKSKIEAGQRAEKSERSANRIKYDSDVFTHLLFKERKIDHTPFEQEFIVGKTEGPIRILMAANLECESCGESFEDAVELVEKYPDIMNLSIRFLITDNSNGRQKSLGQYHYFLNYWLSNIYNRKDASGRSVKLFQDWFNLKYTNKFKKTYRMKRNGVSDEITLLVALHNAWFNKTGIEKTPKFFINGYQLPKNYQISDIKKMMPTLIEGLKKGILRDRKEITSKS